MFSFLRKLWVRLTGLFIQAGDDVVTSGPEAIKSVYAAAVKEAMDNYKEMQQGLALLMQQKQKTKNMVETFTSTMADLQNKLEGALQMAEHDPDNALHKEAGSKYLAKIDDTGTKLTQYTNELKRLEDMVVEYKLKLSQMKTQVDDLTRERATMLAEYMAAKNTLRIEEKLNGIATQSAVDEAIIAIREKVENLKAQVQVATEMHSATVTAQDDVYAEIGAERNAANRFDDLLKARAQAKQISPEKKEERELG